MAPLRQTRSSRRVSDKSSMEVAEYGWQATAPLQHLHVESTIHLPPPSPSECTATSSDSSIVTHLPFAPGSSHTRNRKAGHIPRPPNAFMVFRSWLWNNDDLKSIEKDNRNVSRIAGRYWNELSEAERAPFRRMAEEAKARHALLHPEYKYSPGSQRKPKVSQRRTQRTTDIEKRCDNAVALLKGAVATRDEAMHRNARPQQEGTSALVAGQTSSGSPGAAPRNVARPAVPRRESPLPQPTTNIPAPWIPTPPSQYANPLPVLPVLEGLSETTQIQGPLPRTPELTFPADFMEGFVATDDIPHLSLDTYNRLTVGDGNGDLFTFSPRHLVPATHSPNTWVKPEATSFVDSCMLGAHTNDVLALPTGVPFSDFDIEPYPPSISLGSPVFSNSFDTSPGAAAQPAMLCGLDEMFGQPVSPLTTDFLNENLF